MKLLATEKFGAPVFEPPSFPSVELAQASLYIVSQERVMPETLLQGSWARASMAPRQIAHLPCAVGARADLDAFDRLLANAGEEPPQPGDEPV